MFKSPPVHASAGAFWTTFQRLLQSVHFDTDGSRWYVVTLRKRRQTRWMFCLELLECVGVGRRTSAAGQQSGCAPVHLAARRGQLGIVKVLVEWNKQNADLGTKRPENGFESNKTPLHCAFEEDRLDVIDYLTKGVNVDVNVADHSGENCLFAGVRYDNPESVKLGIEVGADPTHRNSADEAPMDAATVVNSIESMLVLARKEPKTVTAVDDDGNPPLNRCTTVESVDVLVKLGADVNHRNAEGKTALHLTAADPSLVEVSRRLLNNGADADTRDDEDCRPIHAATRMNNEEAVEMLLDEGGADVNAADKHGNTALLLALDGKFESLAEKLLEKGSTVIGTDYNGLTPLHYASQKGYLRLTQRLIDLDAIIEAADAFGKTPLHYAVVEHINVAKELVNLGANMYVRDAKGDTPLGLSRRHGHPLKTLTKEEIELLDFTESSKEDLAIAPGKIRKNLVDLNFFPKGLRFLENASLTDLDCPRTSTLLILVTASLFLRVMNKEN
eukprot:m.274571 g.274571  ORF g.274571 m.274571 type:complete len:502 (+) comp40586_c1_seq22:2774-4279(+)